MPNLGRRTKPLLRQVNNKQHATHNDHEEDSLPTPPASNDTRKNGVKPASAVAGAKKFVSKKEEDIYADPASSSDEEDESKLPTTNTGATFKHSKELKIEKKPAARFKVPAGLSPESTRSKRSASNEDNDPGNSSSSDDKMVFSSQTAHSPNKRARLAAAGNARRAGNNIHAPPKRTSQTYGKKILTKKNRKDQQAKTSGFKAAKGLDLAAPAKPQAPTFKASKAVDMFEFGQPEREAPQFRESGGAVSDSPELSELSELDSDVEEVDPRTLGLPKPKEYIPSVECKGCGKSVPLLLKQEFEDRYNHGKALSYKKWSWFCDHHKKEDARALWKERGYPEIKWDTFERRLRKHHDRLSAVLEKRTPSVYRNRLQKLLDSGSTRSAKTAYNPGSSDDGDLEIKPGYYGSRGERLMTEHILGRFADELRDLAVSDPLIAASGVAGGVSGFVQAVLVPEVAVALVKEDMSVDEKRAREILKESLNLGELLNEEAQERVESEDDD